MTNVKIFATAIFFQQRLCVGVFDFIFVERREGDHVSKLVEYMRVRMKLGTLRFVEVHQKHK